MSFLHERITLTSFKKIFPNYSCYYDITSNQFMLLHENRRPDSDFWACSEDTFNRSAKRLHVISFKQLVTKSELKIEK